MNVRKIEITNRSILAVSAFGLLIAAFVALMFLHMGSIVEYPIQYGWDVKMSIGGLNKKYQDVALSSVDLPGTVHSSDWIELYHDLDVDTREPLTLVVYTRLSEIQVWSGNETIYRKGQGWKEDHRFVGSGYHFILLPTGQKEKKIQIRVTATEKNAFRSFPEVRLVKSDDAYLAFTEHKRGGIRISVFLFLFGVLLLFLGLCFLVLDWDFYPLILIGVYSILCGSWCLSSMKALQLFSSDLELNSYIEYLALFLMPVPVFAMQIRLRVSLSKKVERLYASLLAVNGGFVIVAALLHQVNLAHMPAMASLFHILMILEFAAVTVFPLSQWGEMKTWEKLFQLSIWILGFVGLIDVVWYYVTRTIMRLDTHRSETFVAFGFLIMVGLMVIAFILQVYDSRLGTSERDMLMRLAYQDEMTGLSNRARGEEVLHEAVQWEDGYVVINLDLNGLKTVNDVYGHSGGDQYIKSFSGILQEVFGKEEVVARMGGDEFLVIVRGEGISNITRQLRKLDILCRRASHLYEFNVDSSYGYARSSEMNDPNPEHLYRLADERMYAMKVASKKERKA